MRELGKICVASLCLLVSVAIWIAPVNAQVIFEETFDAMGQAGGENGIDAAVWLQGLNDPDLGLATRLVDLGSFEGGTPGDWALYTECSCMANTLCRPPDAEQENETCFQGTQSRFNGIRSVQGFPRGNNLRVTLTMFGDPTVPGITGEAYPKAAGPFGPWHLTNDWGDLTDVLDPLNQRNGQLDRTIEVGLTYWAAWKYHWEEAGAPGNNDGTGPQLQEFGGLRDAVLASAIPFEENVALQKAIGSIKMRFYVGDTAGGTMEYSEDGGATWLPIRRNSDGQVIDTRGDPRPVPTPEECTPPIPSGETVGACNPLYLGIGSFKHAYFDDIIVEIGDPTGACTLPGGAGGASCEILTAADCLAGSGTYEGDGTVCSLLTFNIPGDCNQDGAFDLSDVVHFLGFLFQGNPEDLPCSTDEANLLLMDCNQDGGLDLSDAVYKLAFLFQGGLPPVQGDGCTAIPDCPQHADCP